MGTHASTRAALAALALSTALTACAAFAGSAGDDDAQGDGRSEAPSGAPTILEDGAVLPPSGDDASLPSDAGSDFDAASILRHLTFEDGRAVHPTSGADRVASDCQEPRIDGNGRLGAVRSLIASGPLRCVELTLSSEREVWIRFGFYIEALPGQTSFRASILDVRTNSTPREFGLRLAVRASSELELLASASPVAKPIKVPEFTPVTALLHVRVGAPGRVEAFLADEPAREWVLFAEADLRVPTLGMLRLGMTSATSGTILLDDVVIARTVPPVP